MSNLLQLLPRLLQPSTDAEIRSRPWMESISRELERRARLIAWIAHNPSERAWIYQACARSILFFIANFGWGYDPRTPELGRYPLLCWGSQQVAAAALANPRSGRLLWEKSRDQGASVIWSHVAIQQWAFHVGCDQGMLTRVGKDLDDGTYNSLFGKIDWLLEALPPFLVPPSTWERKRGHNPAFKNKLTGNVIKGGATTSGSLRGNRYRRVFVDEAAHIQGLDKLMPSLQGLTNNLILASSVNGMANKFAHIRYGRGVTSQPYGTPNALPGSWNILRSHWRDDPRKDGEWEAETRRGMDPADFDQEYDIKYTTTTKYRILSSFDPNLCTYSPEEWQHLWDTYAWNGATKLAWDFGSGASLTGYAAALYFESIDTLIFYKYNVWKETHWMQIAEDFGGDGWYTRRHTANQKPDAMIGDNAGKQRDSNQESWISNFGTAGIPIEGKTIWHFGKAVQMANRKFRERKIFFAPQCDVRRNSNLPSLMESLSSWKYIVTGEGDDARGGDKPFKNVYSHLADCFLYLVHDTWGDSDFTVISVNEPNFTGTIR